MRKLALAYALLFAGIILFFGVKAELFFDMMDSLTLLGVLGGGAFRLGLGIVLIGAANTARYPTALKIIGLLSILGGIAVPIMGADTIGAMAEDIYGRNVWALRAGCAFSLLFMAFVVYALAPRHDNVGPDAVRTS
jgi:hypothetical protein